MNYRNYFTDIIGKTVESPYNTQVNHNDKLLEQYVTGTLEEGQVTRLRFDWQATKEADVPELAGILSNVFIDDLEDLIENGDTNHSDDALLKALDGTKKRGRQPKDVQVIQTTLIQEQKENMNEYIMFLLLYTNWDDDAPLVSGKAKAASLTN